MGRVGLGGGLPLSQSGYRYTSKLDGENVQIVNELISSQISIGIGVLAYAFCSCATLLAFAGTTSGCIGFTVIWP